MLGILIVIFALILVNGFFAAAEMALVSIEPSELHRVESEGIKHSQSLRKLAKDSTAYLSAIQVAITLAGFMSSAFAGSKLSGALVSGLGTIGINITQNVAVVLIAIILSFFTLVLGELAPKRLALGHSLKFALFVAPVIRVLMTLFKPFVWLLTISTKGVLKLFGMSTKTDEDNFTEQKIKEMIVYGNIKGLYKEAETEMLQRIFRFDDLTAEMIMTPIENVTDLDINDPNEAIVRIIVESRYSRIPVFDGGTDQIKGVVLIKDLAIRLKDKEPKDISINDLIRDPLIIKKDMHINVLMRMMMKLKQHLAFVIDASGHTEGIVTLEDIVEEIIGETYDEHDAISKTDPEINRLSYIVDGETRIKDLNATLRYDVLLPAEKDETVSDYVKRILGRLPKRKEHPTIKIEAGIIEVLRVDKGDINQVRFLIDEPYDSVPDE